MIFSDEKRLGMLGDFSKTAINIKNGNQKFRVIISDVFANKKRRSKMLSLFFIPNYKNLTS
ncbi:MAG: hypothetical protein LBH29_02650 [Elusimicrobiota bacterium]|nr:hypothetical protein [Elusimicrobiota bacterium]